MNGVTTASIGRTFLSLSPLTVGADVDDPYQAGKLTPSGVAWDRITVGSPFVHGRRLRAARKRTATLVGSLYVVTDHTADPSVHEAAVSELLEALSQFTYTLTVNVADGANDQSWTYACEPADASPAESINEYGRWRFTTVQVSIPHHPVPTAGAW